MININDVRKPSFNEILGAEPIHIGQFADLKIEEYRSVNGDMFLVRYWQNRVGPEDGEPFRVAVEARRVPRGSWFDVGNLYPYDA